MLVLHAERDGVFYVALQAACDRVNRGFVARLYKTRAYRTLSLIATPYLLPFELAYTLICRSALDVYLD